MLEHGRKRKSFASGGVGRTGQRNKRQRKRFFGLGSCHVLEHAWKGNISRTHGDGMMRRQTENTDVKETGIDMGRVWPQP